MKHSLFLLIVLACIQRASCFQVGSCRLCAKGCGEWQYGGTFRTAHQYGVFKKNNVYEKGCENASQADDIDEYTEQDIMLCCKKLAVDFSQQSENEKSIDHPTGPVVEYYFEEQKARIKAASCKICQSKCPDHMMPRAYFHLDKIGPFLIKPKKGKNETVLVNEAAIKATEFVSIYGYNEECKERITDIKKLKLTPSTYSRMGDPKYLFDPESVMCCDKIDNENDLDIEGEFETMRKKEQCRKDKNNPNIKKKDYQKKCAKIMKGEDDANFRFKAKADEGNKEGEDKKEGEDNKEGEGKKEGEDKKEGEGKKEDDNKEEKKGDGSTALCSFCRSCDPKIHDTLEKCKEKSLSPDPYQKRFEIPAQVQLCCLKNQDIFKRIKDEVFAAI